MQKIWCHPPLLPQNSKESRQKPLSLSPKMGFVPHFFVFFLFMQHPAEMLLNCYISFAILPVIFGGKNHLKPASQADLSNFMIHMFSFLNFPFLSSCSCSCRQRILIIYIHRFLYFIIIIHLLPFYCPDIIWYKPTNHKKYPDILKSNLLFPLCTLYM